MLENQFSVEAATSISLKMLGYDYAIEAWHEIWSDLSQYCSVELGETDNYTKDLIICWGGWVLGEPADSVSAIYDAINGYNLFILDNDKGNRARKLLYDGIISNAPSVADALSGIAIDYYERGIARDPSVLTKEIPPIINQQNNDKSSQGFAFAKTALKQGNSPESVENNAKQ